MDNGIHFLDKIFPFLILVFTTIIIHILVGLSIMGFISFGKGLGAFVHSSLLNKMDRSLLFNNVLLYVYLQWVATELTAAAVDCFSGIRS